MLTLKSNASNLSSVVRPALRSFTLDARNRLSKHFIPVTKDKTSDSDNTSPSHALLLKGGFVRQSGAGIYSLLPLGLRTVEKIEKIIDKEMQAIGSQKVSLPMLLNPEGWKKTGRWDGSKGEFFRLKDRKDSDLLLAPTHEEEITTLVAHELRSSKQLPIRLYQIGRKYRDEKRPRAGLLRGREFIMKDLYSFDVDKDAAHGTYDEVAQAYKNIFNNIGVPFVTAEADSGNIGGSKSHEYHLISPVGEDTLLTCSQCGYTANDELAIGKLPTTNTEAAAVAEDKAATANKSDSITKSIIKNANIPVDSTIVSYNGLNVLEDGFVNGLAAIFTPQNRPVNLLKIQTQLGKYLKTQGQMSSKANLDMDLVASPKLKTITLESVKHLHVFVDDAVDLQLAVDSTKLTTHPSGHFRLAQEGDHCVTCNNHALTSVKAIECGHTFYLGTKYSSVLDCTYREGTSPRKIPAEMGCYGIGVTRILAAVAEAKHDGKGIAWPKSISPYSVCIVPTDDRKTEFKEMTNKVYDDLTESMLSKDDVVIDDRRSGFGTKMKDAELIGYPFTIIVGQKALSDGQVELHERVQGGESNKTFVRLNELKSFLN